MLISASRRTDIPAFYTDWFLHRLRAGYALTRNPMNPRQERRVDLSPAAVDGIVFWTKNVAPMLPRLDALAGYTCYFQYTITAFGPDVEPGLPDKNNIIIPAFQRLADKIGPERVIWRFDPVAIGPRYGFDYQIDAFDKIARALRGYTHKVIFSFMDFYRNVRKNLENMGFREISPDGQLRLARSFANVAHTAGLRIETCAEAIDLHSLGIAPAQCIDAGLVAQLSGRALTRIKDKYQRPQCGCTSSVDIGAYATCRHGCRYCYASRGAWALAGAPREHDPTAPLLTAAYRCLPDIVMMEPVRHDETLRKQKI